MPLELGQVLTHRESKRLGDCALVALGCAPEGIREVGGHAGFY